MTDAVGGYDACDSHIHVFDRRYPTVAGDTRHVPDALVSDYREVQRRIGTRRVVVVQPSTYGTDNRCLLEALAQFGSAARGVAVVDPSVPDDALSSMAAANVRAIRFNLARPGATTIHMVEPLGRRVAQLGWHVQLHMTSEQIVEHERVLERVAAPMVFDHMGRIAPPGFESERAFGIVVGLARAGRAWVKLSAPYLFIAGTHAYEDATALAQAITTAIPERVVWGSDWPHPGARVPVDLDEVVTSRGLWMPDDEVRRAALIGNPATLYQFAAED
ncbi:MAG TPA: amidohydrolase family protein [Casimicrobiaceae bacterium]|nr:amidohydrolase family protein [Casimicrobiaceae bacterium]